MQFSINPWKVSMTNMKTKVASVAMVVAAGLSLGAVGHFQHQKPLKPSRKKKGGTPADFEAFDKAADKRDRKAAKRRALAAVAAGISLVDK